MLSRKFQFYLGIVNTFPAVFYIFLGIFSAFMHKISHSASPREKFYAFWQRKCQEKCRKQLEKWWQFLGKNFHLLHTVTTCRKLIFPTFFLMNFFVRKKKRGNTSLISVCCSVIIFLCFFSNLNKSLSDCSTHRCYNLTNFGQDWTKSKKYYYT